MKRLLTSLLLVSVVSTLGYLGTKAYFSDTEESTGNVLAAGTIDISVDSENPWESTKEYVFENMLPGDEESMTQTIKNVGVNNVVVWKRIEIIAREDNLMSEPECTDQGGTWDGSAKTCTYSGTNINDLDSQMVYNMDIDGLTNIDSAWGVTLADVDTLWVPLGLIVPDGSIVVDQTYHFDEDADNKYQGDKLVFNITYYAEQEGAPGPSHTDRGVVLDNKNTTTWAPIVGDGTWGIATWDGTGNYRVRAWGLNTSNDFVFKYFDGSEHSISGTLDGSTGTIDTTGSYASFGSNIAAKYWLRAADYSNADTLWESNLVN